MRVPRTEFGLERTHCSCRACQINCEHMPGFLVPADLERMIPAGADPLVWAETNLLASPGALVMKDGEMFRIHTLVPAVKPDGSCIHLYGGKKNRRCDIHEIAPFGCAFFGCNTPNDGREKPALMAVHRDSPNGLYARIWAHLENLGKVQHAPEVLQRRIREAWEQRS